MTTEAGLSFTLVHAFASGSTDVDADVGGECEPSSIDLSSPPSVHSTSRSRSPTLKLGTSDFWLLSWDRKIGALFEFWIPHILRNKWDNFDACCCFPLLFSSSRLLPAVLPSVDGAVDYSDERRQSRHVEDLRPCHVEASIVSQNLSTD